MNKKRRILFLSPYPHGIGPSQRFRFEQYLDFISDEYLYTQKTFWDKKAWEILFSDNNFLIKIYYLIIAFSKRLAMLLTLYKYDLVFIHREVAQIGPPIFEWLIKFIFRKKIIYDFDDAIWHLNYSDKNKIVRFFKSPWKVKYICKWSDATIVGNNFLADFAKKHSKNTYVIPTTINTNYHKPRNNRNNKTPLTIGWTGTLTTLKHIDLLISTLKKIESSFNTHFLVISNEKPTLDIKNLNFINWNKETEIQDLQKIDIGIMPLYDNEWEKGKCGFKGLQYMALEIPTIMSPIGVNTEIIEDEENGFLANSDNEWFDKLSLLIKDQELRIKLGKAGRKAIIKKYSVEANKQTYLDIINSVLSQP